MIKNKFYFVVTMETAVIKFTSNKIRKHRKQSVVKAFLLFEKNVRQSWLYSEYIKKKGRLLSCRTDERNQLKTTLMSLQNARNLILTVVLNFVSTTNILSQIYCDTWLHRFKSSNNYDCRGKLVEFMYNKLSLINKK